MTACNQPDKKHDIEQQDTSVNKEVTKATPDTTSMTLPLLDALFYEKDFGTSLKSQLGLSAEQIVKLRNAAHNSVAGLTEDGAIDASSARTATQQYREKIKEILGDEKAQQLLQFVSDRYSKGVEGLAPTKPNFIPTDTRIVVNAPAFRMDIFRDGKLVKTFKVGIGYPEFPLPTGMRRADTIIFNPTWTPPDEPWVKGNFAPGRKVGAGNELNPLGLIKIPIGMPSLIHGGKKLEKIGNFASHGCVGLTNRQVVDFVPLLAQLGGSSLSADSIKLLLKNRSKTRSVMLPTRVPIDLRYETIVAENGGLNIYRDVYERGTNTLDNAKTVLAAYSINYDQLTEPEKTGLNEALEEMNRDAKGKPIATESLAPAKNGVPASKLARSKNGKITSSVKGQKVAQVAIAALQGKGYPAPVALSDGSAGKTK
ncbi:L,D-transpeptidase [Mucilaginibacter conchicola]|nr:L,D-transpeptidase [Mucilaginibacter conchicola]